MNATGRRIRGALGMGLTWAAGWAFLGALLSAVILRDIPHEARPQLVLDLILSGAIQFGIGGFLTGIALSGVLSFLASRGRLAKLSVFRFANGGAVAGMIPAAALSGLAIVVNGTARVGSVTAILAIGAFLGSLSAGLTLLLARAGSGPSDPLVIGSERDLITGVNRWPEPRAQATEAEALNARSRT